MKIKIIDISGGIYRLVLIVLLASFMQFSTAQESTLDNYVGNWSNDATWVSGSSPGTLGLNVDVQIFGYVNRFGDLDFNNGDLYVEDTLVIYGNIDLGNNADLYLSSEAILIVHGDYISGNQVEVANGGALVVTGEWNMVGSDNQGTFDNDGQLYILDPDPDLKTGTGYGDFTCSDPVDSCQQYGYDDLIASGIGDFFLGGTFKIDTSGVTTFCPGGSVTLSVNDTASNYQWFMDGVVISGANTFNYVATTSGDYTVDFDLVGTRYSLPALTVTVDDFESPTITAPIDVSVNADPGLCTASGVVLGTPGTGDNCGIASTTNDAPAVFPLGITTVEWTVTDNAGLTATATHTVTVTDNQAPSITAPADVTVNNDPGVCSAAGVLLGSPTTSDNCGIGSTVNDAPASFPVGTTIVEWTVTDVNGLSNTATHSVTVVDNELPTITAPADVTVNSDPGDCSATGVVLGSATTNDNCGIATTINDAPIGYPVGVTTVTWTVTDNAGLTATATHTVTVIDNEAPTITAPIDVSVNADPGLCTASGVALGTPGTGDNCGIASTTSDAPAVFPLGITTVEWTVTDNAGLTATATHTVTVTDNQAPSITAPADVTVNNDPGVCSAAGVLLGSPTTSDNCGIASTVNDAPAIFPVGTTIVEWTVTDVNGLSNTATHSVTVVDNELPTITAPADVTVNSDPGDCSATGVVLGSATTNDNCGIATTINDAPIGYPVGVTTVTWTVTDNAGLTATATHIVTVIDNEAPTITAPIDASVNADPGLCTASGVALGTPGTGDNCGIASTTSDAPAVFPLGITTVEWTVTDNAGLTATATHTVTVTDNQAPSITAPADVTVNNDPGVCSAAGVILGSPTTSDNCGIASTVNDAPANFPLGTTIVEWTVTDVNGLSNTATHSVTVVDNELPTITAPADVTVNNDPGDCDATGVVLGSATTNDNCGIASTVNDAPALFPLGTTTVTWTVTDNAGLTATATHIVTVIDNEAPTITAPIDASVNADPGLCTASGVALGTPGTGDNCGIASTTNDAPAVFPLGITTVEWTVTDNAGLTATATHTVTVTDNQAPSITAPADVTVNNDPGVCSAAGVILGSPTTSDNCGIASTVNDAPASFPLGTTIVEWTVTDVNGLSNTATHSVTVVDNELPTITAPADVTVNSDPGVCNATGVVLGSATTNDNCGIASTVNDAPALFPLGTTTVTWTVTDNAGLTATATHIVTVIDNEAPTITAPIDASVNADPGLCTASGVALGTPGTGDNCGIASTTSDAPAVFPLGITTVEWTVTDNAGLTATATHTVTVTDNQAPSITAPADVTVNNDPGVCSAAGVILGSPTTSDNCGIASTVNDAPANFPLGTTIVEWTVTDVNGLSTTATHSVTVVDNEMPLLSACPADITLTADDEFCGSNVSWTAPSATDNCTVILSSDHDPGDFFDIGITTVTYTATDASGLNVSCSFDVTVDPPVALTITGSNDVCSLVGEAYTVPALVGASYSWSVTDGSIEGAEDEQTVVIIWSGATDGTVSVIVTSGSGCSNSSSMPVSVIEGIETSDIRSTVASGNPDYISIVCPGAGNMLYEVTAGDPGSTFTWTVEGGNIAEDLGDTIIIDWGETLGEYELRVFETAPGGCLGQEKSASILLEDVSLDLGEDTAICQGEIYSLTPVGDFQSISWHDGSTGTSFVTEVEGLISCTVVSDGGCSASGELYLTVNPNPLVDLGNDTAICGDLILDAGEEGIMFNWSTGESSQQIEISGGIQQEITLIVENEFGCISQDAILIDLCDMNDFFGDIPNTITPNGDGKNDAWIVDKLEGFPDVIVEIYDRWGRLVYKSEPGYQTPWDGSNMNGNLVPTGSYHYVFVLNYLDFKQVSGSMSVIK